MKKNTLLAAVVLSTLVGCAKSEDKKNEAAPAPAPAPQVASEIKNSTGLVVKKGQGDAYIVNPAALDINTISYANNPIKSNCKDLSALKVEQQKIELQKSELVDADAFGFSEHGTPGELSEKMTALDEQIKATETKATTLAESTLTVKVKYSKDALLAALKELRAANPSEKFELAAPTAAALQIVADGKVVASQAVSLEKNISKGAFDETATDVVLTVSPKYEVLCSMRTLKSNEATKASSKLLLKF